MSSVSEKHSNINIKIEKQPTTNPKISKSQSNMSEEKAEQFKFDASNSSLLSFFQSYKNLSETENESHLSEQQLLNITQKQEQPQQQKSQTQQIQTQSNISQDQQPSTNQNNNFIPRHLIQQVTDDADPFSGSISSSTTNKYNIDNNNTIGSNVGKNINGVNNNDIIIIDANNNNINNNANNNNKNHLVTNCVNSENNVYNYNVNGNHIKQVTTGYAEPTPNQYVLPVNPIDSIDGDFTNNNGNLPQTINPQNNTLVPPHIPYSSTKLNNNINNINNINNNAFNNNNNNNNNIYNTSNNPHNPHDPHNMITDNANINSENKIISARSIENKLIPESAKHIKYVDITEYLCMPQSEAAKKLTMPVSTLSKRWKEAVTDRKWPYRKVSKLDKQITTLLHNIPQTGPNAGKLTEEIEQSLARLLRQRQEELKPVYIRL